MFSSNSLLDEFILKLDYFGTLSHLYLLFLVSMVEMLQVLEICATILFSISSLFTSGTIEISVNLLRNKVTSSLIRQFCHKGIKAFKFIYVFN